jgi:biopolymer transport protein ExbD
MQSRRKLFLKLAVCFVATGFVVASVVADELLGVLSKVDVEGKKITVVEKDTDKEIEVKVTDDTEYPKKGNTKYDLEKLEGSVKKATDAGKKVNVKVTHDKNVASKIEFQKKKGAGKKKDN